MTFWDWADKHTVWCWVFGFVGSALVYEVAARVENYLIQRLNVKLRLAANERSKP